MLIIWLCVQITAALVNETKWFNHQGMRVSPPKTTDKPKQLPKIPKPHR